MLDSSPHACRTTFFKKKQAVAVVAAYFVEGAEW